MKFRKKPVVIEAVQFKFTAGCIANLREFMGEAMGEVGKPRNSRPEAQLYVRTLEDTTLKDLHLAIEGDWIIKGVKGEFYPCKPDIFEETYEKV